MADQKLSALTELAVTPADTDEVYIRDVSEAAANESKRITIANLMAAGGVEDTVVSDLLQHSNDAAKTTTSTTYVKKKEIVLTSSLTNVRIKFGLRDDSGSGWTCYGKIYKNGNPIGIERSNNSSSYVTFSEDFTGLVVGDLIQIYAHRISGGGIANIGNMRLYYSLAFPTHTNQDP